MKHPEEVVRLFNKTDEEVLQQSDVLLDSFQKNKTAFIERFTQLSDPFADEWAQCTLIARAVPPDYATVSEQANQTATLENLMDQGRTLFQTVMLYVELAFPNNPAVMRLFGQSQYNSARNNQLKLPILLRTLHTQLMKPEYYQALIAKGLRFEDIERIESTAQNIITQDIAQQNAKKDRTQTAHQRIAAMNAVWEKMALVCQSAKLVFQDDATTYNLFLLTDSETPKPDDSTPPSDAK